MQPDEVVPRLEKRVDICTPFLSVATFLFVFYSYIQNARVILHNRDKKKKKRMAMEKKKVSILIPLENTSTVANFRFQMTLFVIPTNCFDWKVPYKKCLVYSFTSLFENEYM